MFYNEFLSSFHPYAKIKTQAKQIFCLPKPRSENEEKDGSLFFSLKSVNITRMAVFVVMVMFMDKEAWNSKERRRG